MVEHLPSMCKNVRSCPSATNTKESKRKHRSCPGTLVYTAPALQLCLLFLHPNLLFICF